MQNMYPYHPGIHFLLSKQGCFKLCVGNVVIAGDGRCGTPASADGIHPEDVYVRICNRRNPALQPAKPTAPHHAVEINVGAIAYLRKGECDERSCRDETHVSTKWIKVEHDRERTLMGCFAPRAG